MKMLVDQLLQRFRAPSAEDVYRLISALLQEALGVGPHNPIFDSLWLLACDRVILAIYEDVGSYGS